VFNIEKPGIRDYFFYIVLFMIKRSNFNDKNYFLKMFFF